MEMQQELPGEVAPIMTIDKTKYFLLNVVQTLFGVNLNEDRKWLTALLYFLPPLAIIIISTQITDKTLCLVLGTFAPLAVVLTLKIVELLIKLKNQEATCNRQTTVHLVLIHVLVGVYSYLVTEHLRSLVLRNSYHYVGLSIVTLSTSLYTLHSSPVKEFSMQSEKYNEIAWTSTATVRPIVTLLILIPQAILLEVQPDNIFLWHLQTAYTFMWLVWSLGAVGCYRSTLFFIMETINVIVFGDNKRHLFYRTAAAMCFNIAIMFILHTTPLEPIETEFMVTNCLIILLSFITSLPIYNFLVFPEQQQPKIKRNQHYAQYIVETVLMVVRLAVTVALGRVSTTRQVTFWLLLGDLAVFGIILIINDFSKARSHFGLIGCECLQSRHVNLVIRSIQRLFLDVCMTFLIYNGYFSQIFPESYLNRLALRIMAYRSYKRAINSPLDWSIHISYILALVFSSQVQLFLIPLLMIPLPENPLLLFTSVFVVPKKNKRKHEWAYTTLYMLATLIGYLICVTTGSMLQPIMMFGLPIFLWSYPMYHEARYGAHGKQRSIYQNMVKELSRLMEGLEVGTYIVRVSKYLVICRVIQRNIGYSIVEFRGLESQEPTSCHSVESRTIDNMIEQTWGKDKLKFDLKYLLTILRPLRSQKHTLFEQNQINLTGLVDSQDFARQLKINFMKILMIQFSRFGLSKEQIKQVKKIKSDLEFLISEKEANQIYPHEFAEKIGGEFTIVKRDSLASPSFSKHTEKLPPLKHVAKKRESDDLDFLADEGLPGKTTTTKNTKIFPEEESQVALPVLKEEEDDPVTAISKPSYPQLILAIMVYCLSKNKFIDQKKLFELMKSKESAEATLKNLTFDHKGQIVLLTLRAAFKITIDYIINGEELTAEQISQQISKSFIGLLEEKEFQEAVDQKRPQIWVLNFKDNIRISRYAEKEDDIHLFHLENSIVTSVWNNLRFEMYYVTNDDDERYSIQTHPDFLRNMLIESCIEPLGYAPFYSGALVI